MATSSTPKVSIGAVSERDVDFLLVEEFASSPDFVQWFLDRIDAAIHESVEVVRCRRSATDSIGESDVEVFVRVGDEIVAILVEDKVHAAAQPCASPEPHKVSGRGHRCLSRLRFLRSPGRPPSFSARILSAWSA